MAQFYGSWETSAINSGRYVDWESWLKRSTVRRIPNCFCYLQAYAINAQMLAH